MEITGGRIALVAIATIAMVLWKKPVWRTKLFGAATDSDPRLKNLSVIAGGLLVFNLVSWGMIPWFWSVLSYTWSALIFFNIGLGVVLFLLTIKEKDASGKEGKEPNSTARKLAYFIAVLLVAGLLTSAWKVAKKLNSAEQKTGITSRTRVDNYSHSVPIEIALAIIADHESGNGTPGSGKQFLAGTTTPIRNPQNAGPGKGAVGKWQINLSDPAVVEELKLLEAEMKKDGRLKEDEKLDVEGNENHNRAAAEYLFGKYRTNPWNASRDRWEPKLRAYTWGGGEVSLIIMAPVGKPSDSIPNAQAPRSIDYSGGGKKYFIIWNGKIKEELPRPEGAEIRMPPVVDFFQFEAIGNEPVPITLKIY